ncbi:hypothetical protein K8I61_07125, partial [bacterium]|nr:hypothetical protein [bacterium]
MSANETPAGEPIDLADVIADLRDRIAQLEMRRDELNADVDAANAKLEKAESKRGKVRPEVFEKVVAEYAHAKSESEAARAKIDREAVSLRVDLDLAETTLREREEAARLAEEAARRAEEEARRRAESATLPPAERQEIERRIEEYRAESGRIESELEEPDKALEELEFRRDMDEFATDDEYEKAVGPVRETIERLRGRLAQIEGESAELRKTLEEDAAKAQAAARPVEAAPAIADSADDQAGWSWADSGGAARAEGEV